MSNIFDSIKSWIYSIIVVLFDKLGFMPKSVHYAAEEQHDRIYSAMQAAVKEKSETITNLYVKVKSLTKKLDECDGWTISTIKAHAEQIEAYYKETQKSLERAISKSGAFDFVKDSVSPGSTSIGHRQLDKSVVNLYGKSVLMPETAYAIQDCESLADKYACAINQLAKYGTFTSIVKKIIDSGSMKMYLVYNADTDQFELYWDIITVAPNSQAFIEIDNMTAKVQEMDEVINKQVAQDTDEVAEFIDLSKFYQDKGGAGG